MMDNRASFSDVRFALLGFEPLNERQVRCKLLEYGGVDVGLHSPDCTHLIVDRITYDHPVCVAARKGGKAVVTALWVHHGFDLGMPVDVDNVIYRPVKQLNGIPGATNLVICLTGYSGEDRQDIMIMVDLLGAQFSKALVASKTTHLICYKAEGAKYNLAKDMRRIKIVNHRWLQDCLRDWILHPEDRYSQSGYELDLMEAEAKDSEDEAENTFIKQSVGRSMNKSRHNIQAGSPVSFQLPKSEGEVPMVSQSPLEKSISRNEDKFDQASRISDIHVSKIPSPQDACKFKDAMLAEHNDLHHKTPDSKMKHDMTSTFGSAKRSSLHSDGKLIYSRQSPWKSTLPLQSADKSSYGSRSSKAPIPKYSVNDDFASSSFRAEENEKTESNCVEALFRGNHVQNEEESSGILPQKRTPDHSHASSKLQKTRHDAKASIVSSPSETLGAVGSPTKSSSFTKKSLTSDVLSSTTLISEIYQDGHTNKRTPLSTFQRLRKSPLSSKPAIGDLVMESTTKASETVEPQNQQQDVQGSSPFQRLRNSPLSSKLAIGDLVMEESLSTLSKTVELQNQQQDIQGSSPRNKFAVTNNDLANLDLRKGGTDDSTKSDSKKMLSMKTLGSRPKLTSANHKFSVNLDEYASLNIATVDINPADQEKSPIAGKPDLLSPDVSVEVLKMAEVKDVTMSGDVSENKVDSLDDETEAPEEEDQHELEETTGIKADIVMEEKSEGVQDISNCSNLHLQGDAMASGKNMQENERETVSLLVESTSNGVGDKGKNSWRKRSLGKTKLKTSPEVTDKMISEKGVSEDLLNQSDPCVHGEEMAAVGNMPENEQGETVSVQVESTSKGLGVIGKKNSGKRGPLGKTKLKTVPAVTDKMNLEKGVSEDHSEPCVHGDAMASIEKIQRNEQGESVSMMVESTSKGDGAKGKKNNGKKRPLCRTKLKTSPAVTETEETEMEGKGLARPAGKSKCHSAPKSKPEESSELKENRPIDSGVQNMTKAREQAGKSHVKCNFTPMEINQKLAKISRNSSLQEVKAAKTQPEWFILSGHQFERKEFQQIIKRLKGRCCRDSHNWSYQATHFIMPEPIRRIEKFFAAAASGRWILKSDYLAASSQAGKFVAEEPYEWYKSGLSEDGTINLEAPRKWRHLRERTGHGAFHGMRIIIYGDCIAPRLDTLKRVVKAGDGTILATCPPYTRFLDSGVDFAIVSPGMPRVDMWVQEFLKHEIPCVAADYLVEYVCKPGYPLERHVLYNTHAWAEKSFGRLQNKAEEVLVVVEEEEEEEEEKEGENRTNTHTDDPASSDIPCVVCGSFDRGEVMLICGNESGSVGCGIGTHIDCCSPPLEDVPEDDWFCPKCSSESRNTRNPSKKRKKGKSK